VWFDGNSTITAVLNGHLPDRPAWGDHRAVMALHLTPEWTAWMAGDRKPKTQEEFALWLEENDGAFRDPSGATLLEMIITLEGKKDCRWNRAIRLQNGQVQFGYDEDISLRTVSSQRGAPGLIELPSRVVAGIAPFKGCPLYQVSARLRYRLRDSALSLWLETIRPDLVRADAITGVLACLQEALGQPIFHGSYPVGA
jgi:uncharacterized protein YfdQ (DUF2303 family)